MKIYYIRPKTTKRKSIKLYSISSLFYYIAYCRNAELQIILIVCLLLAIVAACQTVWIPMKSKKDKEREEMDNRLKEHDRQKKIQAMLEDTTDKSCKNVNVSNLI